MSIWCPYNDIGNTEWPDEPSRGTVRSYAVGWSNHYPDDKVEQPSAIGVASIPAYCVPDHSDETDGALGPWLQLSIDGWDHDHALRNKAAARRASLSVVLDEEAVTSLVADLTAWLARPKVHPTSESQQP